ncbi:Plasmid maintenance system antidote protein [Rhodospirillaceae bacterium LM-1]|nr:Plasmid maintenance system antidote protein [Rhodospirillaceae bacterium LM-1]
MTSKSSITIKKVKLPPIHPGEILQGELEELGVSVTALARALDVPQSRMAEIVKGERGVSADTALRLSAYFGTSPRLWLNLQTAYDLATTEAANGALIQSRVRPFAA